MKTPYLVAIMNLFIWGSGYLYLKKAWGWWIVLLDIIVTSSISATLFLAYNVVLNLVLVVISILFAWHGYEMAKGKK